MCGLETFKVYVPLKVVSGTVVTHSENKPLANITVQEVGFALGTPGNVFLARIWGVLQPGRCELHFPWLLARLGLHAALHAVRSAAAINVVLERHTPRAYIRMALGIKGYGFVWTSARNFKRK